MHLSSRAGRYPYYSPGVLFEDFFGLVSPCIGRSSSEASIWGKWNNDCVFKDGHAIFELNRPHLASTFFHEARKRNIPVAVIKSWREKAISTGDGNIVVFARVDYLERIGGLQDFVLIDYIDYVREVLEAMGENL